MEIQTSGKSIDSLLEKVLCMNILSSDYFKELYSLKTFHEVVDEVYNQVDHVEPWMTGNCRGPSSSFCLLYKFFTMKLTVKQMQVLLTHKDSPYIRALGFLYLRYYGDPKTLWGWFEPYVKDDEEFSPGSNGKMTTMGVYVRDLLLEQYYFDTLFPRIPVPIIRQIVLNLERMKLPMQPAGVTGSGGRHVSDDIARRPPSVKASLSVSFGQRAPHRASTRDSSPVRRSFLPPKEAHQNGDGDKERARSSDRDREREKERSREVERERERDYDRGGRGGGRVSDHERSRNYDRDARDRQRDRDHDYGRRRERERERERERDRDRERERERERHRDRERSYDGKAKEYSSEREKREKQQDSYRSRSRSPLKVPTSGSTDRMRSYDGKARDYSSEREKREKQNDHYRSRSHSRSPLKAPRGGSMDRSRTYDGKAREYSLERETREKRHIPYRSYSHSRSRSRSPLKANRGGSIDRMRSKSPVVNEKFSVAANLAKLRDVYGDATANASSDNSRQANDSSKEDVIRLGATTWR